MIMHSLSQFCFSVPQLVCALRCVVILLVVSLPSNAQVQDLDPSQMFFTAYNYEKSGQQLLQADEYNEAVKKFQSAQKLLNDIYVNYPTWNPKIVKKAYERASKYIQKVDYERKQDTPANAGVGLVPEEDTPRVKRAKERVAEALRSDEKLDDLANRTKKLKAALAQKERELEQRETGQEGRATLLQQIQEKDAALRQIQDLGDMERKAAALREQELQKEVQALKQQLEQSSTVTQTEAFRLQQEQITQLQDELRTLESEKDALIKKEREQTSRLVNEAQAEVVTMVEKQAATLKTMKEEKSTLEQRLRETASELIRTKQGWRDTEKALRLALERGEASAAASPTGEWEQALLTATEATIAERQAYQDRAQTLEREKRSLNQKYLGEIDTMRKREKQFQIDLQAAQDTLMKANLALQSAQKKAVEQEAELATLRERLEKMESEKLQMLAQSQEDSVELAQLRNEIQTLKQERDLLLMRPLRTEVMSMEEDLVTLQQEKQGLMKSLTTNEERYFAAEARISALQEQLVEARTVTAQFEQNVNAEREISNEIIRSQRERLETQNKLLSQTERDLAAERAKATKLQTLLDETRGQYASLSTKYENLVAEHEQLRTMMEGEIDENVLRLQQVKLERQLRESRQEYDAMLKDKNALTEDLAMVRKKYSLARTELSRSRQEMELSAMRAEKLHNQLVQAKSELALAATDPQSEYSQDEITVLRDLVDRQLKLQKNRQLARSIILDRVNQLGIDDTEFISALNLAETQEIILSDEQQRLLATPNADGEFSFSDRATPEERARANAELSEQIQIYDNLGRSAYNKKHYAAAEEFFRLNLEAHPGHVPSMMNLGVSRLRYAENQGVMDSVDEAIESFEDAIALSGDQRLPYAHQMLGYAHYTKGDLNEAEKEFFTTLELDTENANAHIFLATIAASQKDLDGTEAHLQAAIKADATLTEPHFNLAWLYSEKRDYSKALQQYRLALKKGAIPDNDLEQTLRKGLPDTSF